MKIICIQKSNCKDWRNKTNSTGKSPSPHGTWLDYLSKNTNTIPRLCCVKGCTNRATVGAHIYQKHYCRDVYIAPYCSVHNNCHNDDYNTLNIGTVLVHVP